MTESARPVPYFQPEERNREHERSLERAPTLRDQGEPVVRQTVGPAKLPDPLLSRGVHHPLAIPSWFVELPVQQQSVLMLALRGPDGIAKHHPAKGVHRCYRATILLAARYGRWLEIGEKADTFMDLEKFDDPADWRKEVKTFFDHVDELPHHYAAHLAHAAQILGYKHPNQMYRSRWIYFYARWCDDLHVEPEDVETMDIRLNDWARLHWSETETYVPGDV